MQINNPLLTEKTWKCGFMRIKTFLATIPVTVNEVANISIQLLKKSNHHHLHYLTNMLASKPDSTPYHVSIYPLLDSFIFNTFTPIIQIKYSYLAIKNQL